MQFRYVGVINDVGRGTRLRAVRRQCLPNVRALNIWKETPKYVFNKKWIHVYVKTTMSYVKTEAYKIFVKNAIR